MKCQVGTTRNHSMTARTATNEKAKFTNAKSTFCTGKRKRSTLIFFSSEEALMIEVMP